MIGRKYIRLTLLCLLSGISITCVKPFEPPILKNPTSFLVVEGVAFPGKDTTIITLSRSRNLSDTTSFIPELGSLVRIVSQGGQVFQLTEKGNGRYAGILNLSQGTFYQIKIFTAAGGEYESSLEPVIQTPPIDSLTWSQDVDVTVKVNTHDPLNQTRYYRWDYMETWEYRSFYESFIGYKNGHLYFLDPLEMKYQCWDSLVSTNVIIGASEKLSEDLISNLPITVIPNRSYKISAVYSIKVRQYGLTETAFNFWQEIKKNGSQVGGLFDPLPSQLIGNIRCISNPAEPVIGYFSIASVQEKRMFIYNREVINWKPPPLDDYCKPLIVDSSEAGNYLWDPKLAPAFSVTGGDVAIANVYCVDCRLQGGINRKPGYWP